jgi:hypothetical protein
MTIDASLLVPNTENTTPEPGAAVRTMTTMGPVYIFNNTGDVLATHQHVLDATHITIVLSGSLTLTDNGVSRTVNTGDVIDLGTDPHSFVALEPAQIMNITKIGVSLQSLAPLTSRINGVISHLYTRIDDLNNTAQSQESPNTDITAVISDLYTRISDLKTLTNS